MLVTAGQNGGGSQLLPDPATIPLGDVWRIVQGANHVLGSYAGTLTARWAEASVSGHRHRPAHPEAIEDELEKTTIAQLVDQATPAQALTQRG